MTKKKNRVSIFGKTFHVTPAGKILPLGSKNNWFTKCVSNAANIPNRNSAANRKAGIYLSPNQIEANQNAFLSAVKGCKSGTSKAAVGRPKKK